MFQKCHNFLFFLVLTFLFSSMVAQNDQTISGTYTIEAGDKEVYDNLTLDSNESNLIVNGTLIVNGDLNMSGAKAQFTMGDAAVVIVYGDFIGSNKVNISISSFLIIQGSFIRPQGSNQATLNIDNGNIYIFGDVDGWPPEFSSCETYEGNTTGVNSTECEYGTIDNFEDNYETFPPEVNQNLNCFEVTDPEDQISCEGSTATFFTSVNTTEAVNFQWQVKTLNASYTDISGATTNTLSLNNITADMDGNRYRVKVTPANTTSLCKISFSKSATLTLETTFIWNGTLSTSWNNAGNWSCNTIPTIDSDVVIPSTFTNRPIIYSGTNAYCNDLSLATGIILEIQNNSLSISGDISGNGQIKAFTGTLIMKGSNPQVLNSGLLNSDRLENLVVNNPKGVTTNTLIELTGWLRLTNGNFQTNDKLKLISNEQQTALIEGAGNGTISGNVIMQRYIDPAFGYKYIGTPFQNNTVADFSRYVDLGAGFPMFYKYDESREDNNGSDLSGWEALTSPTEVINYMEGYALNFGNNNSPVTLELTGLINNGLISKSLTTTNGKYTKGFHLVSNPYPSPIDWNMVTGLSTNIDAAAYFFRTDVDNIYTGTYASIVGDISSAGNGGGIIPSMQGFFVHTTDGFSTSILNMDNNVRINDFSQEFYKSQNKNQNRKLIRLSTGFLNEGISDPLVIYFDPRTSLKFEGKKDALKLYNQNNRVPNFFAITSDSKETSIKAVPFLDTSGRLNIPIGIQIKKSGTIIFKLEDFENINKSMQVYLIDKERNISIDINKESYQVFLNNGTHLNRFQLSFKSTLLPAPPNLLFKPFLLKTSSNEIGIKMNLEKGESGFIRFSTLQGQLLSLHKVKDQEEISFKDIRSSGIYFVTYISEEKSYTKKVIIRK